jgi:hypothetical protein
MTAFDEIEARVDAPAAHTPQEESRRLLLLGEEILVAWVAAHGSTPTDSRHEGFRLLALQRQGARGDPSFNACRETCRELAYRYNLAHTPLEDGEARRLIEMMRSLARHLLYFVGGKLENAKLGEFCCSSRPLRVEVNGD